MIRWLFVSILLFSLSLSFAQKPLKKSVDFGNVDYLTKEQLHDYLSFIASDELEGRDTPSRGLDIAAKFLATNVSRWGYTPAGDNGSFFQKISLLKAKVIPQQTSIEIDGKKFSFGTDFIAKGIGGNVTAPVAYVKNGYIVKSKNINPYVGIDVKGKILVVLGGYPKGVSAVDFGRKIGVDYDSPGNYAKTNGALAIITIPSARTLAQWEKDKKNVVEKGSLSVTELKRAEKFQDVPSITASQSLIDAIFSGEETGIQWVFNRSSADSVSPFVLSERKKITVNIAVTIDTMYTQNVVAVLEGADKKLKDEYVAFGAHYDHIGVGTPVNGDSINNGADDDGSGTSGLLAMAEAFAKGDRPKRSLLFVWHVGEEKGLWGSKYFVKFPTVPLKDIVVQLNIDMIGRSKSLDSADAGNDSFTKNHEIFSIGSNMMSTELGKLNEEVNASLFKLKLNYKFDDPKDPQRLFYRSDHYNYAKNGVPIVFYFDGIHEDYHQVTDEIDRIDFDKYLKVTKTIYALGWRIANLPQRIVVDKQFSRDEIE